MSGALQLGDLSARRQTGALLTIYDAATAIRTADRVFGLRLPEVTRTHHDADVSDPAITKPLCSLLCGHEAQQQPDGVAVAAH
jgi:hypothetical protein